MVQIAQSQCLPGAFAGFQIQLRNLTLVSRSLAATRTSQPFDNRISGGSELVDEPGSATSWHRRQYQNRQAQPAKAKPPNGSRASSSRHPRGRGWFLLKRWTRLQATVVSNASVPVTQVLEWTRPNGSRICKSTLAIREVMGSCGFGPERSTPPLARSIGTTIG